MLKSMFRIEKKKWAGQPVTVRRFAITCNQEFRQSAEAGFPTESLHAATSSIVAATIRITGVLSLLKTRWPTATKGNVHPSVTLCDGSLALRRRSRLFYPMAVGCAKSK